MQYGESFPETGQAEEELARVHQRSRNTRGNQPRDESRVRRRNDQGQRAAFREGQQRGTAVRGFD